MKTRLISVFLALCLVLSLLPVSALAADGFIEYPVEGGSIYFDTTTGMVMGADRSVTAANIPAQIGGVAVTGIYKYAFRGWKNLTTVTLPETITVIGETAFMDCSALHSINLPDGLTKVSDNMFYNCTSLREIVLPDSITMIGG